MPVKLMSLEEAAAFLMMESKELRALATSGEIPCIYQGSRMLFEHGELDTWYSNRLVTHQPVKHQEYAKMVPEGNDHPPNIKAAKPCKFKASRLFASRG